MYCTSAFSKTWLPPELRQVLSCESPAVFLHFPLEEKGLWGPFYQLWQVLAKGRHLLQILQKALQVSDAMIKKSKHKILQYSNFRFTEFSLGFSS